MACFSFPMALDPALGRFLMPDEAAEIRQSVLLILTTRRGERPFRPDFGTHLDRFAFENPDTTACNMIRQEIVSALHAWEDRVREIEVAFERQDAQGALIVHISYTVRRSGMADHVAMPLPIG